MTPQEKNARHQMTDHHVPPTSTANGRKQTILKKPRFLHESYHNLFKNAGTKQECFDILSREWWPD